MRLDNLYCCPATMPKNDIMKHHPRAALSARVQWLAMHRRQSVSYLLWAIKSSQLSGGLPRFSMRPNTW
jgi:hypothetical protein